MNQARSALQLLQSLRLNRIPGQLVIQLTDRCNARCPQCGMRVTEGFSRSRLAVDDVKRMLDAAVARGFQVVSFTGGEPLLFLEDLAALIRYAGQVGVEYIRTGTNGFVFAGANKRGFEQRVERVAATLAETPLRNLWISIDSAVPEVHEQMRGFPGLIAGIEKALPVLHDHGIFPAANLGINRRIGGGLTDGIEKTGGLSDEAYLELFSSRFREAFRRFFRFVRDMGFTMVNMCYPMSFEVNETEDGLAPVYQANSVDRVVRFSAQEKACLFRAVIDTIPEFRPSIRVFSPRSSLFALHRHYMGASHDVTYPCRGGIDFFFVDARDANTYPCGFRGSENLGKFWEMNGSKKNGDGGCRLCDWECFRDPSELFGPLLEGFSCPLTLLKRVRRDGEHFRLWMEDLRYYWACDLFDGRKPLDAKRLAAFGIRDTASTDRDSRRDAGAQR